MDRTRTELIKAEQIAELSDGVFNQHFDNSSAQGFTFPLLEEEELAIVRQMLVSETPAEWVNFLQNYISHYALFNSSAELLIENISNPSAQEVIIILFENAGTTVAQADKICRSFLQKDAKVLPEVMIALCDHARNNDKNLLLLLDKVEEKFKEEYSDQPAPQYAARYIAGVSARHSRV